MKNREHLGRWRNEASERRFRAVEDQLWRERWPQPPVMLDVDTTWGLTRVYRWEGEGAPIVLLHGMGGTSVMWSVLVDGLAPRPVYAVDTLGDVGRSVQRAAFDGPGDVAAWVDQTVAGLGLDAAHLVGNSYGGWLALNAALRAPARVLSISLLDPAGMAPISYRFFVWGAQVFLAAFMPAPIRRLAARRLGMPLLEDKRIMRMAFGGQVNHPFRLPLEILSDADLRRVEVPTLLLVGEKSEIYRGAEVVERARQHMPNVTASLIAGVGHALPVDPKAEAPARVKDFLDRWVEVHP